MCAPGVCGGGAGLLPEVYFVTVAAQNGGNDCPITNGTTRFNTGCINSDPCPINCKGGWAVSGNCTGGLLVGWPQHSTEDLDAC